MSTGPDWSLIRWICRTVSRPEFGGGVRREHLGEMAKLPPRGKALSDAIAIGVRVRQLDVCGDFVVPGCRKPGQAKRRAADADASPAAGAFRAFATAAGLAQQAALELAAQTGITFAGGAQ